MLRQLREGNLDANQYAEEDEMLYSKQVNADGTTNLQWLRSSGILLFWSLSRQQQSQLKAEVFRDTVILVSVSSAAEPAEG
ncbi:unnamed protein product [Acanthoscelides obtectus]|uniref:Uncharacterized protein n=1 Tax=Acanthoscelides obtectus TaxID=200917 RepID=A0A9P0VSI3_ACAOB|nr:unnamed protein product [Acanthoscelides obtectus]CAK1682718.1 hypothetical protein AOBTE_LOCUS33822 [Acanthoscelides obtectus]